MKYLVTGAAGFIGFHLSKFLLDRGDEVVGVDNLNAYYEVQLKEDRLAQLQPNKNFSFNKIDIADRDGVHALADQHPDIELIIHLAAQAGVRYSLIDPYAYVSSNVMGQVVMCELARKLKNLRHFVYASSSSVYGNNETMPFSVDDAVNKPNSLYAATKRADELIGNVYAHLYGMPSTGLRFFTVYGPWGRPDMAAFLFVRAILAGEPIRVFNRGEMWRDFTYIDDIVKGIVGAAGCLPTGSPPHAIYNLGNNKPEKLTDFIATIERVLGVEAKLQLEPMQPGDVPTTYADIEASQRDFGFEPKTQISEGLAKFVGWYKDYYRTT